MKLAWIWLGVCLSVPAGAADLGKLGPTFPIGEEDLLTWIERRLTTMEASGELTRLVDDFQARVRQSVSTPPSLGLPTTERPQIFYVDPTLRFGHDILHPVSREPIARAGDTINPFDPDTWPPNTRLQHFRYNKVLVFLDTSDQRQIRWAASFQDPRPIRWILTGGNPKESTKDLSGPVYFDQRGDLVRRLHVRSVPSWVEQSGRYWRVTEVDISLKNVEETRP
ncbi:conjugal transfer pilus assembly protein TraW (plasmid) [Vibrio nigripulchritudo]|uniref:type-F conjugative transfer system protein TraW n=1 Tax=Vibrio nigripulchritudo TaxID=28173 RepID=UPI00190A4E42|nr:type-F conjugative transfer system protein TraW [Vibrio nigripulchritudo]BCL73851.1 conjugal transfer pilus assembly protein TraW [Vibrio nigripulchritudo]BDU35227.1 conjugal transfer pilus assembly protein TraW [Vibrio nigripulchritudo]